MNNQKNIDKYDEIFEEIVDLSLSKNFSFFVSTKHNVKTHIWYYVCFALALILFRANQISASLDNEHKVAIIALLAISSLFEVIFVEPWVPIPYIYKTVEVTVDKLVNTNQYHISSGKNNPTSSVRKISSACYEYDIDWEDLIIDLEECIENQYRKVSHEVKLISRIENEPYKFKMSLRSRFVYFDRLQLSHSFEMQGDNCEKKPSSD